MSTTMGPTQPANLFSLFHSAASLYQSPSFSTSFPGMHFPAGVKLLEEVRTGRDWSSWLAGWPVEEEED